jgi:hypothetical protein
MEIGTISVHQVKGEKGFYPVLPLKATMDQEIEVSSF